MASKEERERRRQERLAAEQREARGERRRLIIGYVVAGALALAVVVGIGIAIAGGGDDGGGNGGGGDIPDLASIQAQSGTIAGLEGDGREGADVPPLELGDLEVAAEAAGCEADLELSDEGSQHVEDESVDYGTNPPTSGNHNPDPQADGAYAESPQQVNVVHALEHGRVAIHYSPDLPEEDQLALKGVFDEDPAGMLLFPNPDMPFAVAATAWRQLLGCESFEGAATLDAIRDFRDIYRGNGPENFPLHL